MNEESDKEIRLSKILAAHTGLSRREATSEIQRGEVSVNGVKESNPARIIQEGDRILYKDKALTEIFPLVYYVFNKPKSMLWEGKNEKKRPSVLEIMRKNFAGPLTSVYPIPDHYCGLAIITNDEDVIQKFNEKTPLVKQIFECTWTQEAGKKELENLADVLTSIPGLYYKKTTILEADDCVTASFEVYGKGFETAEKTLLASGPKIQKIDRIFFGGITKKDIGRGWFRILTPEETLRLKYFFNPLKSEL